MGLLIVLSQFLVLALLICLTLYAVLVGCAKLGFEVSWIFLTPMGMLPLVLIGHAIEWLWGGPVMGVKNGRAIFPLVLAFAPIGLFWLVGIGPAALYGWRALDVCCRSPAEKVALLIAAMVLGVLGTIASR